MSHKLARLFKNVCIKSSTDCLQILKEPFPLYGASYLWKMVSCVTYAILTVFIHFFLWKNFYPLILNFPATFAMIGSIYVSNMVSVLWIITNSALVFYSCFIYPLEILHYLHLDFTRTLLQVHRKNLIYANWCLCLDKYDCMHGLCACGNILFFWKNAQLSPLEFYRNLCHCRKHLSKQNSVFSMHYFVYICMHSLWIFGNFSAFLYKYFTVCFLTLDEPLTIYPSKMVSALCKIIHNSFMIYAFLEVCSFPLKYCNRFC